MRGLVAGQTFGGVPCVQAGCQGGLDEHNVYEISQYLVNVLVIVKVSWWLRPNITMGVGYTFNQHGIKVNVARCELLI